MRHKIAFSISWRNYGFFQNVEIMKINGLTSLALIGGKTSRELLDSKSPHSHPMRGHVPTMPIPFRNIRHLLPDAPWPTPGANENNRLNIIGFNRWKNFARTALLPSAPATHHPPPARYNLP